MIILLFVLLICGVFYAINVFVVEWAVERGVKTAINELIANNLITFNQKADDKSLDTSQELK